MRKIKTFSEFIDVTGMLTDCDDLVFLGLSPDNVTGTFWPGNEKPLLEFCQNNPKFHVGTYLGDAIYVNRYVESGGLFWIGDGDESPDIWYENTAYFRKLYFR